MTALRSPTEVATIIIGGGIFVGVGIPIIKRRMTIMRGASILTTITLMWVGILVRIVIVVVSWARVFTGRAMMRRRGDKNHPNTHA